jgi:hypothetical protein
MHPFDGDGMAGKPSRAMGCQLKGFRFHPEKQRLIDENRRIRKIMIRKIADRSKTSKLPIESHPAEEKPHADKLYGSAFQAQNPCGSLICICVIGCSCCLLELISCHTRINSWFVPGLSSNTDYIMLYSPCAKSWLPGTSPVCVIFVQRLQDWYSGWLSNGAARCHTPWSCLHSVCGFHNSRR